MQTYTVKKGDSLWGICSRRGLEIEYIAAINGFTRSTIHHLEVGQIIKLPVNPDDQADCQLSIRVLDLALKPIKKPTLKLEYDGKFSTVNGDDNGWIQGIAIHDLARGIKVNFKQIDGSFELIADHKTVPMGKKVLTLTTRTLKKKGRFLPKDGTQKKSQRGMLNEIKKNNSQTQPITAKDKKLPRQVPEKTPTPTDEHTRMEDQTPVHVVADIYTEENLLLPAANEKYRPLLIKVGKKYNLAPQALAAKIDVEAAKGKGGVWKEGSAGVGSALGLTQFLPDTWLALAKDSRSLMAEHIKRQGKQPSDQEILRWRTDAEMSIDTAALYIIINLEILSSGGIKVDNLPDPDKIKVAYLAHHDGAFGAGDLIKCTTASQRAQKTLTKQLGKGQLGLERASRYAEKFSGDYVKAYRHWVFVDLIDSRLHPEHFMVNPEGYKVRAMSEIAQALGGPSLVGPNPKQSTAAAPAAKITPPPNTTATAIWHDPLEICTLRTKKLASKRSATFGMVRNNGHRAHQGIDLAASPGTTVYAVARSKVIAINQKHTPGSGYGKTVLLEVDLNDLPEKQRLYFLAQHPQNSTVYFFYAHLKEININIPNSGEILYLDSGRSFGTTGSTGNADGMATIENGAHLHFEARHTNSGIGRGLNGRMDPLPFIEKCTNS